MSVSNLLTNNLKSFQNLKVASLNVADASNASMDDFDEISGSFKIDQYASGVGINYTAIKINGFVHMVVNATLIPDSKITANVDELQSQDFTGWKQSFNAQLSSTAHLLTYNGATEADGRQIGHIFIDSGDMTNAGALKFYRGPQLSGNQWTSAPAGGGWPSRFVFTYKAV